MKRKTLIFTALLLFLAGIFYSCKNSELQYFDNVWECNPESNVTITLTFDSLKSMAYVNTEPQWLDFVMLTDKRYLFFEDDIFVVRGDTLFISIYSRRFYDEDGQGVVVHSDTIFNNGFIRTMLSQNSMELNSFNWGESHDLIPTVRKYLFTRKIKES